MNSKKLAKTATTSVKDKYGIKTSLETLQFVWFNYTLGNMKCLLFVPEAAELNLYPEVTFIKDEEKLVVDVYKKDSKFIFDVTDEINSLL